MVGIEAVVVDMMNIAEVAVVATVTVSAATVKALNKLHGCGCRRSFVGTASWASL